MTLLFSGMIFTTFFQLAHAVRASIQVTPMYRYYLVNWIPWKFFFFFSSGKCFYFFFPCMPWQCLWPCRPACVHVPRWCPWISWTDLTVITVIYSSIVQTYLCCDDFFCCCIKFLPCVCEFNLFFVAVLVPLLLVAVLQWLQMFSESCTCMDLGGSYIWLERQVLILLVCVAQSNNINLV